MYCKNNKTINLKPLIKMKTFKLILSTLCVVMLATLLPSCGSDEEDGVSSKSIVGHWNCIPIPGVKMGMGLTFERDGSFYMEGATLDPDEVPYTKTNGSYKVSSKTVTITVSDGVETETETMEYYIENNVLNICFPEEDNPEGNWCEFERSTKNLASELNIK